MEGERGLMNFCLDSLWFDEEFLKKYIFFINFIKIIYCKVISIT